MYVSFMPDKYIYVIDKKSKQAIGKFGAPGRDMNINYQTTTTYEQAEDNITKDLKNYGYYRDLKLIPEDDLIFRPYTKDGEAIKDGMQIYKNYNLIGDIDIPKGFKIIGKIDDFFIGSKSIEGDEEEISIYKIKLKYEE